jgi:catechol 2,3-dioxygenase-like lactoylglutathione lyase family enzyme
MDHVGIVVDDLAEATAFFSDLGLELLSEWTGEGEVVDRIIGLAGVRTAVAMMQTPDGHGRLELIEFHTPPSPDGDPHAPSHAPGIRHVTFAVDDLDAAVSRAQARGGELVGEVARYGDTYRLCYLRGPAGIILELAERIDGS